MYDLQNVTACKIDRSKVVSSSVAVRIRKIVR